LGDRRGLVAVDVDQALAGNRAHGLTDRVARDAELARQAHLRQRRPRWQLAREDPLAEARDHLLVDTCKVDRWLSHRASRISPVELFRSPVVDVLIGRW